MEEWGFPVYVCMYVSKKKRSPVLSCPVLLSQSRYPRRRAAPDVIKVGTPSPGLLLRAVQAPV